MRTQPSTITKILSTLFGVVGGGSLFIVRITQTHKYTLCKKCEVAESQIIRYKYLAPSFKQLLNYAVDHILIMAA